MAEQFLLEVDGEPVGSLRSFQGLDVEAEIATRGVGPHNMPKKHVAVVHWTPGVATFGGGGMGKGMRGWIAETLDRGTATRSGSVAVADAGGSSAFSVAFSGARLSAVSFPALDGASKEAALMAVEFAARQVRWGEGGSSAQPADRSKEWLRSNFRVEIGGLPCNRVARVDGFTWTCAADGTVAVPDVRLVISRADLAPWEEAARRWFIDGDPPRQARDERPHHPPRARRQDRARHHRARQRRAEEVLARRRRPARRHLRRGALCRKPGPHASRIPTA